MINLKNLTNLREKIKEKSPLIHAITNPIAINMCANAILGQNALAICAEHPKEVEEIVEISSALSVNLGNITDSRIKSIDLASKKAMEKKIPVVIDLVGVGVSKLRYDFAKNLLEKYPYALIKGNASEIRKIAGIKASPRGIDVGEDDEISEKNITELVNEVKKLSQKYKSSILITGKTDILLGDENYYLIENGVSNLSKITGTGCMLTCLISSYTAITDIISASLLGLLILEISAELVNTDKLSSFNISLMDKMATISDEQIIKNARIKKETYEKIISGN